MLDRLLAPGAEFRKNIPVILTFVFGIFVVAFGMIGAALAKLLFLPDFGICCILVTLAGLCLTAVSFHLAWLRLNDWASSPT